MNLSAVTISVNYSDYLVWSLPTAKNIFDRLIVVTSKDDKETKRVCDYYWVECLQTDIMTKDEKFNKGLGINLGLEVIGAKDWCVHFDSDIVFPPRFNDYIRSKKLDKSCLYGVDRLMVKSWEQWISFYQNPFPQHYVGSAWPTFDVGYRVVQGMAYSPIGYFQLFNMSYEKIGNPVYPDKFDSAADSDLRFSAKWPEEKRLLIPELFVYHLSTENSIGVNWNGRKTKAFGPEN
jgi:hypothetical protein